MRDSSWAQNNKSGPFKNHEDDKTWTTGRCNTHQPHHHHSSKITKKEKEDLYKKDTSTLITQHGETFPSRNDTIVVVRLSSSGYFFTLDTI